MSNTLGGPSAPTHVDAKRMLSCTKVDNKYHVEINSSSLDVIQTCPRKAFYSLHRGLVSGDVNTATQFGKAIHAALEVMYATPRDERTLPPRYKEKISLMCQGQVLDDEPSSFVYQATRAFITEAAPLADLPIDDKRSITNGGYLLGEYFEKRWDDPYEVMFINGEPAVEKLIEHVALDTEDLKITLFGTVDAIMENRANGQKVICDHKTTALTYLNDFYNRTKPNSQYSIYVWLAQKSLGLDIENFMINCFQVKARPKTSRGKGPDFLHLITRRTPEDLEDMIKTLEYWVRQYIHWLESEYWPLSTVNACANYGSCQYLKVCSSPESIKENIISAEYEERPSAKT